MKAQGTALGFGPNTIKALKGARYVSVELIEPVTAYDVGE